MELYSSDILGVILVVGVLFFGARVLLSLVQVVAELLVKAAIFGLFVWITYAVFT